MYDSGSRKSNRFKITDFLSSFNFLAYYEDAVERTRRFKTKRQLDEALAKRREKETNDNTLKQEESNVNSFKGLTVSHIAAKLSLDDVPKRNEMRTPVNDNREAAATHTEPTIFTSPSDDLSGLADDPSTSNASCID